MPFTQKSAISFGLVYIPVILYAAIQDTEVHFNQITKDGHKRVRYVKTCAGCKRELTPNDIVKGFQYEKDKYVIVDDADFEKIKTEKDRSIQILHFTKLSAIPPIYFEKPYLVMSQSGGEKALELLLKAMLKEDKVAIGKTVMGMRETILALLPTTDGLLLETLHFQDEIREVPKEAAAPKVSDEELIMARQLVKSMTKPFDPALYRDEYQAKLRDLITQKIEGKEVIAAPQAKPDNIVNLMDALKQSLARQKNEPPAAAPKPKQAVHPKTG